NSINDGIIIGFESDLPLEYTEKLLAEAGYDNLKLYFDTQNPFYFNKEKPWEIIEKLGASICEVHAKDGKDHAIGSSFLGTGEAGFTKSAEALRRIGYQGWIHLENTYDTAPLCQNGESPLDIIKKDMALLKQAFV